MLLNPIMLSAALGEGVDKFFYSFDMWVFNFLGSLHNGVTNQIARFFTNFGDEKFAISLVVFGIVLCFFKKTRKIGFSLIFAMAIGTIFTNAIFKPMFLRVRPYNTLQHIPEYMTWYKSAGLLSESDYSFPSGHTTVAFDMATAMFIAFYKDNKKKIAFIFPILAICTMISRVALMVHYASDVLGGMIIGIICGTVGYLLACLVCKIKLLEKIDLGKLKIFKNANPKALSAICCLVVVALFTVTYIPTIHEGGAQPCAYNEEYDCMNAARIDDEKYPAIDGKEYCKIHWKQLNNVD